MGAKKDAIDDYSVLALPMAVAGLRTRDVGMFCAGVSLVMDTIAPGAEYGVRKNAITTSARLTFFASSVYEAAELTPQATNPLGAARSIYLAVVAGAFWAVTAEAIKQRLKPSEVAKDHRDLKYWTAMIHHHINDAAGEHS